MGDTVMACQRIGWAYCSACGRTYRARHTCDQVDVERVAAARARAAAGRDVAPIPNELETLVADATVRIEQLRERRHIDWPTPSQRRSTDLPTHAAWLRSLDA